MLSRIQPLLGRSPIVFAGTAQTILLGRAASEAGIDRRRLIGSAPVAFVSALAAIVAVEARCSPRDVALTVLGVPPHGLVVPWSGASIGGYPLLEVLSAPQLNRLEVHTRALWPPGAYATGAAASRVVDAILGNGRQSVPVLTWLTGEYGVTNRAGVVHAALGTTGIRNIHAPELTSRERSRLLTALGG
jgi:malate/lactate dehydrogenase